MSRAYVEGSEYAGGIDHLIMITPPNHGSNWTSLHLAIKIGEHIDLALHEKGWRADDDHRFAREAARPHAGFKNSSRA